MPRIRTIKPSFFRHEVLQDLERESPGKHPMLVFAALWGHCDSKGRFEWKPRHLKLDILPFLDFDMAESLELLSGAGLIRYYCVEDKEYGEVPTFLEHQRITGKEATSGERYPSPPKKQQGITGETPVKPRGNNGASSKKQPDAQEKEEERGKRKEEGEPPCHDEVPTVLSTEFIGGQFRVPVFGEEMF